MGGTYYNWDGAWHGPVKRPFIKINDQWVPGNQVYCKVNGAWVLQYVYDATPPPVPSLSLQIIDNRFIRVSCRLPDTQNNPDLKMIKVLAGTDYQPGSQFGSGAVGGNSADYPHENWSDWYYNNSYIDNHGDSSLNTHKDFPVNPDASTNLPGEHNYYFSAWSVDFNGNWSVGNFTHIYMPKQGVAAPTVIKKELNVNANAVGSLTYQNVFQSGIAKIDHTPTWDGITFTGYKFTDAIGQNGIPTVTSARILLHRRADAGQPQATVRIGWHEQPGVGNYDSANSNDRTEIGTIAKGEAKWFPIPVAFYRYFNNRISGFVFKRGPSATDDYELSSLSEYPRQGEVNITWDEAP